MARKFLTHVDFAKNEIQNGVLQNLASAPGSPVEGQVYYDTGDDMAYFRDDTTWVAFGSSGSGATNLDATLSATQTVITSDTGTDATIPAADATNAGVMTNAMYSKLDGIEASADVTDAGNVGSAIHGATGKTTPVNADTLALIDSEASNVLKKITYQNLSTAITALLIDSAPGTLDTLNELAAAIGDDANFASTVTTALGTKLVKADNLSDVANAATAFGNIKQAASTTATGVVELTTEAETEAKTDTTRAVTAVSLVNFPIKRSFNVGDNSSTSIALTHSLGTRDVQVEVYDAATYATVECDIVRTSTSVVTLTFTVAPGTNAYRAVIVG